MTAAEIAEMVARLDVIEAATKAMRESLQARAPTAQNDEAIPDDLMRPGDVIHIFGIPRSTLHRLCRANPISNADGFAFFDPVRQRYLISRSRIEAFLRRNGTLWDVKPPRWDTGGTSAA